MRRLRRPPLKTSCPRLARDAPTTPHANWPRAPAFGARREQPRRTKRSRSSAPRTTRRQRSGPPRAWCARRGHVLERTYVSWNIASLPISTESAEIVGSRRRENLFGFPTGRSSRHLPGVRSTLNRRSIDAQSTLTRRAIGMSTFSRHLVDIVPTFNRRLVGMSFDTFVLFPSTPLVAI